MGEAPLPPREFILVVLQAPRDQKIDDVLADLANKHPQIDIEYHDVSSRRDNSTQLVPEESWRKATILVTLYHLPPDIKTAKNLKLVHLVSAGANLLFDTPLWKDTDITITNSSGIHGPQISEWVLMQILAHSHKEKVLVEWQKHHIWGKHANMGTIKDSVGQRLGVLGYGAIGRQTGKICAAMAMDVIAYTASPRTTPESKKDHGYVVPGTGDLDGTIPSAWYSGLDRASLHHFLSQDIDVLLISVPLTPQTRHFIGEEELEILSKRKAFIINIARGSIIVQDDLIAALKAGKVRGAALDVTDPEPLPADSELWDLENVAITPHVSGSSAVYVQRTFQILDQNLTRIERGEELLNVVDRQKGYSSKKA